MEVHCSLAYLPKIFYIQDCTGKELLCRQVMVQLDWHRIPPNTKMNADCGKVNKAHWIVEGISKLGLQ